MYFVKIHTCALFCQWWTHDTAVAVAVLLNIDVINVEMKIKKNVKNVKNVEKIKKNVCKRWIKTLPTFAMNPTIVFAH